MSGECQYDNCKFSHDIEKVWAAREKPDLSVHFGVKCPVVETFGYCWYGFNCRYGECHIERNAEGKLLVATKVLTCLGKLVNKAAKTETSKVLEDFEENRVSGGFVQMLRDRRYKFEKVKAAMVKIDKKHAPRNYGIAFKEGTKVRVLSLMKPSRLSIVKLPL